MLKNFLKISIGIAISGIFLYFSMRGLDFHAVGANLKDIRPLYLLPIIITILLVQGIRSYRWAVLMLPVKKLPQKTVLPISCIGYMAASLLPMRIGEIVRPYLISIKSEYPFSSAVATIFIERIFDLISLLVLLFLNFLFIPDLPEMVIQGGKIFFTIVFFGLLFMIVLVFKTNFAMKVVRSILRLFPARPRQFAENFLLKFIDGFRVLSSFKRTAGVFLLSLSIWSLNGLATYYILKFCNINLPLIAGAFVLVITAFGISLPAAPGFLGNFQYASILALSYYGVEKAAAFAFSIISYVFGVGIVVLLGLIFLSIEKITFKEMMSFRNRQS